MKIVKKLSIGFLALVVCFCSCFKFVNAFQDGYELSNTGPIYQSNIGSIDLAIGEVGTSVENTIIPFQTNFYYPSNLNSPGAYSSSKVYGLETNFTFNDTVDAYYVTQEVYFSNYGILTYNLHFTDIFVYNNLENEIPLLIIDNGYTNYEQNYDLTYKCSLFNTSTLSLDYFENNQSIQFDTTDSRVFTFSLENLFQDITAHNLLNTDHSHGGIGFIKDLTISINMLDQLSSTYPTTIKLQNMRLGQEATRYSYDEFNSALVEYETPGVFGWLLNSINSFMSAELFPNFSIGVLLGTIVAIPLLIYILRLFMGG